MGCAVKPRMVLVAMAWIGSVVLLSGEVRDLALASSSQLAQDRARRLAVALRLDGTGILSRISTEARPTARPYCPHLGDRIYFSGADTEPEDAA